MTGLHKPGDRILDRFTVLELLGSGGVGDVYRVRENDREFAVKALSPRIVSGYMSVDAIKQHLAFTASANPVVVSHEEILEENGRKYVVAPYVKGVPLRALMESRLKAGQSFDPLETFLFIDRFLTALASVPVGLVHGGLRPENIILQKNDISDNSLTGEIRITDFGLNKIMAFSKYAWVQLSRGAPYAYLAPEFVTLGGRIDQRADIYAVAALAYEMCAGRVHQKSYAPLHSLGWDGPAEVDKALSLALSRAPEDRPARFKDLQSILRDAYPRVLEILSNSPVELASVDVFTGKKESTVQVDVSAIGEIDAFAPASKEPPAASKAEAEPKEIAETHQTPRKEIVEIQDEHDVEPVLRGTETPASGEEPEKRKRFGCIVPTAGIAAILMIFIVLGIVIY